MFVPCYRLELLRKGTGGRSSFNGVIATVFGSTGFLGRYLVNALGKNGTMMILPYRAEPYFVNPMKLAGDLGQVQFQQFSLKDEASVAKVNTVWFVGMVPSPVSVMTDPASMLGP